MVFTNPLRRDYRYSLYSDIIDNFCSCWKWAWEFECLGKSYHSRWAKNPTLNSRTLGGSAAADCGHQTDRISDADDALRSWASSHQASHPATEPASQAAAAFYSPGFPKSNLYLCGRSLILKVCLPFLQGANHSHSLLLQKNEISKSSHIWNL